MQNKIPAKQKRAIREKIIQQNSITIVITGEHWWHITACNWTFKICSFKTPVIKND